MAAWCSSAAAPRVVTSWPSKAVSGGTAPFWGRFRPARRADRPVPEAPTRSLSPSDAPLINTGKLLRRLVKSRKRQLELFLIDRYRLNFADVFAVHEFG